MSLKSVKRGLRLGVLLAGAAGLMSAAATAHQDEPEEQAPPSVGSEQGMHRMMGRQRMSTAGMPNMRMPRMDPSRGRRLFVEKGCIACHAINGVGGHDAANLDAHTMTPVMNPFEFAAKMWRMAPYMIAAQEEALGEQIIFTGDELADIIAFVHNDEEQHKFTEADLTPEARRMMRHSHGEPGGGPEAHGEELGHHGTDGGRGHEDDGAGTPE
ncbi:MAG: c-type cytochrome [Kiloniellaceae bacterium]